MTPAIDGLMLLLSSSVAASILVKATLVAALGFLGAWLTRRSTMRCWPLRSLCCCRPPRHQRHRKTQGLGNLDTIGRCLQSSGLVDCALLSTRTIIGRPMCT
jgi:hypothetical protein